MINLRMYSFVLLAFFNFSGCADSGGEGGGTATGNPVVELKFDSYSSPLMSKVSAMAVDSLKLCFKRLRFKVASGSTGGNIDLEVGELSIVSSGVDIASVSVPEGVYDRVEFDLSDECGNGYSVEVDNSSGVFQTTDNMTIKFEGTFVADQASEILLMSVQDLIDNMDAVTSSGDIKTQAEAASGTF